MMKRYRWWALGLGVAILMVFAAARIFRDSSGENSFLSEEQNGILEAGLTLRNVTLEQQDDEGQLLWRVHAEEVTYSPDKEFAQLTRPEGELYQDGQVLYRVSALAGTIRDNGQVIFLHDNIVANGIQNKMELRGQSLKWFPENDIMIVEEGITGTHPDVRAKADTARVYDREQRMEFVGEVVATTVVEDPQQEPWVKLQGETFQWMWEDALITSDAPLRIERFENQSVTDVLTSGEGEFQLSENVADVSENVNIRLLSVPLTVSSNEAVWDIDQQTIKTEQAVNVVNPEQAVSVTANQGNLDIETEIVNFVGDVTAISQKNKGQLTANRLSWNLSDQTLYAEGAVNYRQVDPKLTIQGATARGRIEEQTVVVEGRQTVTEIVPNF